MELTFIVTAGGIGKRMQTDLPKQFLTVKNIPILFLTLQKLHSFDSKASFIITLPKDYFALFETLKKIHFPEVTVQLVEGGMERFHSVKNALEKCTTSFVAIHDGVRPFVSLETLQRLSENVSDSQGVIPVLGLTESLRKIDAKGSKAVKRNDYFSVQTPQFFPLHLLKEAYNQNYSIDFTDDASVFEANGNTIICVDGNDENLKITRPIDLKIAEFLLT